MLGISTLPENQGADPVVTGNRANEEACELGSSGFGQEDKVGAEESDRSLAGGNRWPRPETLALLKIRSDMDSAFRDANLKAPLWDEVSRKMVELGYNRNAKKCKEKFENIYKYHRRTKEGQSVRPTGKTYRFFDQLEALNNHLLGLPSFPSPEKSQASLMAEMQNVNPITTNVIHNAIPCSMLNPTPNFMDTSTSTASYSSKESEGTHKKKRKFSDFFKGLMKEVIAKQENLQNKFIETLERCEEDRIAREEAWKKQELARINRERELLGQERSIAAAKDAAVLSFLKNFSGQMGSSVQLPESPFQVENVIDKQDDVSIGKVMDSQENNSNCGNSIQIMSSSSRWPKEEVDALIRIRTNLGTQYQENTPKGPLWEEISAAMKKIGYDRSSKRCKEKWENINKYFKRVKESNKKRPEDSKTCPYFHQLDALYKEKTKKVDNDLKPEELLMHMMGGQEERNWVESNNEDNGSENVDKSRENQQRDNDQEEEGGEEEEEDDDDQYQVVAHNNPLEIMS